MSCYFIAQIAIHDPNEYQKYLADAGRIFKAYNGKYLAVENAPHLLEGVWDFTRTVLIRFPTSSDFYAWYKSPEYQRILTHRLRAAVCNAVLINGMDEGG